MTILDNLRDTVRGAARSAVRASSEFIEVTKINLSIKSEEDKEKEIMFEIGKAVFESYKEGKALEAEISLKCEDIIQAQGKIIEMKDKIMEIKNLKKCEDCGAEVDSEGSYCHRCGKRII